MTEAGKKNPEEKRSEKKGSDFKHLKWPSIIMAILIVVLIVVFDYCSRTGNI